MPRFKTKIGRPVLNRRQKKRADNIVGGVLGFLIVGALVYEYWSSILLGIIVVLAALAFGAAFIKRMR